MVLPRRVGGLGFRLARVSNIALLGKLSWAIIHDDDKLWVKMMRQKYLRGSSIFNVNVSAVSSYA